MRRLLAAAALTGLLGCVDQLPVTPNANALIVQAVLDAGAPDQYVIVQQTEGAISQEFAVEGATVTLIFPDGQALDAVAEHDPKRVEVDGNEPPVGTIYHFALGARALTPGGTYQLRVVTPDGRVVTGETTIPHMQPVSDTAIETVPFALFRDTLALAWRRVAGASSYEVHVGGARGDVTVFTDTSIVLTTQSLSSAVGGSGTTSALVVSAVDANYYDYYRHKPDSFTGNGVISHLNGAIGLFGSIVEVERRTLDFR